MNEENKKKDFIDRHPFIGGSIFWIIIFLIYLTIRLVEGDSGVPRFDPRDGDDSPYWD